MVEVVVDAVGRLLIPKQIRELFSTRRFFIQVSNDEIVLKPVKSWDELFGAVPELSVKKLKKLREEDAAYDG